MIGYGAIRARGNHGISPALPVATLGTHIVYDFGKVAERLWHARVYLMISAVSVGLSGCSSTLISASGPSTGRILRVSQTPGASTIRLVDVDDAVARRLLASRVVGDFSRTFGDVAPNGMVVGTGDALETVIWEAPPAALFGAGPSSDPSGLTAVSTARPTTLPEQMVGSDGRIAVPFAGKIQARGRTTQEIAADITQRLAGKAHLPQVAVRITRNATANVTVVGDVTQSTRLPLTVRGERLLDAIASAGGVRQPIDKITVQITRGDRVETMPLARVVADPRQNVVLSAGDVVAALYQPLSFTVLGATGRNEELPMEAQGITLGQALGRIGGLQDQRADARGLFIFRFEDPALLDPAPDAALPRTPDGRVAVIYRVDLRDPRSFFVAQSFPIRDKDIVYVSNAALTDVQKFVSIITSTVFPVATLSTTVR